MGFKKYLDNDSKDVLIIAETAFSHEGSKEYLIEMINQLAGHENIAIKLQVLIDKDDYLTPDNNVYQKVDEWLLSYYEWKSIIEYAYSKNVPVIIAVLDLKALDLVNELKEKVQAIEIHPSCIPDINFMNAVVEKCKNDDFPLFVGISGFSFNEITFMMDKYLNLLKRENIIFMYGFQNYPTDFESINLNRLDIMGETFHVKLGYADHTDYNHELKDTLVASVYGKGINIFEIHYVLEYGVDRIDYITAYDSERIFKLRNQLNQLKTAFGEKTRTMSKAEGIYSKKFRKVPVFKGDFAKGTVIDMSHVVFKRANIHSDIDIIDIQKFTGKKLSCNVLENQIVELKVLE
ncbi:N-acetylneuraminate synthase family protein [Lutibacter sp. B2]|nr:N-acetylneuraminate synthase family protein [Lutibacter sp. B2]